ncbi:MAG TPA: vWA domain-containing protein [Candidatus Angelobacter sp.]
MLILIDTSGSMDPTNSPFTHRREALEILNKTLDELLDKLPPHVRLEFGVFNNNTAFGPEFTADGQQLRRSWVDSTERAKGNRSKDTALYDAVKEALERFDSPQPGDSILMLTDGGDNISRAKPQKLQEEAAKKGVRLFTVLFLGAGAISSPTEGSPQEMFDFAERTGGSVHVVDVSKRFWTDAKERERAKQEFRRFLNNEVLSGYLLHLKVPAEGGKERKWLLAVDRLPGQKTRTILSYPSRLSSCSRESAVR